MQIVVTGACSVLGQAVLRAIVARDVLLGSLGAPVPVRRIIAVDRTQPARLFVEPRVEYVCGNFEQSRFLARVMGTATDSIFHLAPLGATAGIGGQLEDLDLALMRSLDTTRSLVDACQFQSAQPRFVLASAAAARQEGGSPPATVEGICCAMCELFLIECARRAYVDLRGVRLPCIIGGNSSDEGIALDLALAGLAAKPSLAAEPAAVTEIAVVTAAEAAEALVDAHELPRAFPGPAPLRELPGRVRPVAELVGLARGGNP
jgi:nucleoside-diphosphate-sugar epimerase